MRDRCTRDKEIVHILYSTLQYTISAGGVVFMILLSACAPTQNVGFLKTPAPRIHGLALSS